MATAIFILGWVLRGFLIAFGLYNVGLALFALRSVGPCPRSSDHRFLVVVPAHNEEKVVARCVESLMQQDYPRELYDVVVVADRCRDDTAQKAREAGAIVLERRQGAGGKPAALREAFKTHLTAAYDAVCVLDADNLADVEFLAVMSGHLGKGEQVIQGYLDTKNPADSWITSSYAIAYWTTNRLFQLAKYRLGLSCALGGTGFCIRRSLLVCHPFDADVLTDDLEYQMRLLESEDVITTWAHDAIIYDEKPVGLPASWRQRIRWMQGHWWVACRYTLSLTWQGIRRASLRHLDGAIYCLTPSRFLFVSLLVLFGLIDTFLPGQGILGSSFVVPAWIWWVLVGIHYGFPLLGLYLEKIPARFYWRYVYMPVFSLTWIPIGVLGFWKRNETNWVHTEHTRDMTLGEVTEA